MINAEQSPAGTTGVARGTGRPDRPSPRGGSNACKTNGPRPAVARGRGDHGLRLPADCLPPAMLSPAASHAAGDLGPGHRSEPLLPLSVIEEFRAPAAPPGRGSAFLPAPSAGLCRADDSPPLAYP